MNIKKYFQIIYKRLWIAIVISLGISGLATYLTYFLSDSLYEARFSLYVSNKKFDSKTPITYEDMLVSSSLAFNYSEIAKSSMVTSEIIKRLGLKGITPGSLSESIKISVKKETNIIHVGVWSGSSKNAVRIAETLVATIKDNAVELTGNDNVRVINPPKAMSPLDKGRLAIVIFVSLAGMLLSAGIVVFIDYIDDTVKTPEDVAKHLGSPVLGTIPDFKM